MMEIPLTRGKHYTAIALVDDEDYPLVSQYVWHIADRGRTRRKFYAVRNLRKPDGTWTQQFMHNLIMNAKGIDHKDNNGLNNQRLNLRVANQMQNGGNMTPRQGSSSKYKGVSWRKDRDNWTAYIHAGGRKKTLGSFDSEIEAAKAYDRAALTYFGEFAKLNFEER